MVTRIRRTKEKTDNRFKCYWISIVKENMFNSRNCSHNSLRSPKHKYEREVFVVQLSMNCFEKENRTYLQVTNFMLSPSRRSVLGLLWTHMFYRWHVLFWSNKQIVTLMKHKYLMSFKVFGFGLLFFLFAFFPEIELLHPVFMLFDIN